MCLDLELLAVSSLHTHDRLVPRHIKPLEACVSFDDLLHLGFNAREVFFGLS